jgi:hypothetical protein
MDAATLADILARLDPVTGVDSDEAVREVRDDAADAIRELRHRLADIRLTVVEPLECDGPDLSVAVAGQRWQLRQIGRRRQYRHQRTEYVLDPPPPSAG